MLFNLERLSQSNYLKVPCLKVRKFSSSQEENNRGHIFPFFLFDLLHLCVFFVSEDNTIGSLSTSEMQHMGRKTAVGVADDMLKDAKSELKAADDKLKAADDKLQTAISELKAARKRDEKEFLKKRVQSCIEQVQSCNEQVQCWSQHVKFCLSQIQVAETRGSKATMSGSVTVAYTYIYIHSHTHA
jgi:hypothetical protein